MVLLLKLVRPVDVSVLFLQSALQVGTFSTSWGLLLKNALPFYKISAHVEI